MVVGFEIGDIVMYFDGCVVVEFVEEWLFFYVVLNVLMCLCDIGCSFGLGDCDVEIVWMVECCVKDGMCCIFDVELVCLCCKMIGLFGGYMYDWVGEMI